MSSRGILAALLGTAAVASVLVAPSAHASVVTARALDVGYGQAKVSWTLDSATKPALRTVRIERKLDDGAYALLYTKKPAAKSGTYVDKRVPSRYATYRVSTIENGSTTRSIETARIDTFPDLASTVLPCPSDYLSRAFTALNQFRRDNGVDLSQRVPLREEVTLDRAAQYRANWLATHIGQFNHDGFGDALLRKFGYPYVSLPGEGENIAGGDSPEGRINGWATSPGHRANLLAYTNHGGIGCVVDNYTSGITWVYISGANIATGS